MRLVWLVVILAGCSAPAPEPVDDGWDLQSTSDTGVVRGAVVDEVIRPLAGATVNLHCQGVPTMQAQTKADGLFGFAEIPPGTCFVIVNKVGYTSSQSSVEVAAGVNQPTALRIVLVFNPDLVPYFEPYKFDGFIECSVSTSVLLLAACSAYGIATEPACETAGACQENVTNDRFLVRHEVGKREPAWVQSEMRWDSTQAFGDSFFAIPGTWDPEADTFRDAQSFEGPNPIVMPMKGSMFKDFEDGHHYQVRIFTGRAEDSAGNFGATAEQHFELFTHVFYGFTPPEGWSFGADGAPEVPT